MAIYLRPWSDRGGRGGHIDVIKEVKSLFFLFLHATLFEHSFLKSGLLTRANLPEHFVILTNIGKVLLTSHARL